MGVAACSALKIAHHYAELNLPQESYAACTISPAED